MRYSYNSNEIFQICAVLLEGGITATSILFEKYKVTDIVYESDTVTVYKTEHIYMSVKRIVKRILKNSVCRDAFYSEVNILKNIKHPNIPTIYDVEEDNQAYFIIEEYIEGANLDDFVRMNGVMSERDATDVGIKLCRIVSYLHNQKPIPILFLDVHPKNILLDNGKIYLVDFGSSYYSDETEKRKLMMGTVGYAAPEQYKRVSLDERTDIYGIGAVLYFLVTGRSCDRENAQSLILPNNISEKLKIIILQCLAHDRKDRFQSVEALSASLLNYNEDNVSTCAEKSRIISFAGADRRVGVTHICLAFAAYLSGQGYKVLYEEANESNHLRVIAGGKKLRYQNGFFYCDRLMCKPLYGAQIILEADCDYVIRDCGVFDEKILKGSGELVLIAGAKYWEIDNSVAVWKRMLEAGTDSGRNVRQMYILCNSGSERDALSLWRRTGSIGKRVPMLQHLMEHDKYNNMERQFFGELEAVLRIHTEGGEVHRKRTGLFRKITEKAGGCSNRYMGRS